MKTYLEPGRIGWYITATAFIRPGLPFDVYWHETRWRPTRKWAVKLQPYLEWFAAREAKRARERWEKYQARVEEL